MTHEFLIEFIAIEEQRLERLRALSNKMTGARQPDYHEPPDDEIPFESLPPARSQPAPAQHRPNGGQTPAGHEDFHAETLDVGVDGGSTTYKVRGGQYKKFGVRIWPEVLQDVFGFDLDTLRPGLHPFKFHVRVELRENGQPRKVVGLAQ